jgi:hypothetical protein
MGLRQNRTAGGLPSSEVVPVAEGLKNSRSAISVLLRMLPFTLGFPQPVYGGSFCLPIQCFWTEPSYEAHESQCMEVIVVS